MKNFVKLCKMSQKDLKKYTKNTLLKIGYPKVTVGDGFVYAQGELPILLVAHLDTVHKELPKTIYYDDIKQVLSSPEGIGGDDRCGVYMIFEVIKKHKCSVLFCEEEEIGAKGEEKFVASKVSKGLEFNYIMEFDRRGSNDAVFYDCDNYDFEKFITKKFFKTAYGSFSDISVLAPELGCAAVNLSCGYYNAHTLDEYVVWGEMNDSINAACDIICATTEKDKFEYIESAYYRNSIYDYGYGYGDQYVITYDNGNTLKTFETTAQSEMEAIGLFCVENPTMSFQNIMDIQTY